jgi:glutamate/aspartate transport system permease protein
MYVNRLELGDIPATGPSATLPTRAGWSGFQITVALSISAWIIAFLVGSLFGILRTVPIASSRALAPAMSNCFATCR